MSPQCAFGGSANVVAHVPHDDVLLRGLAVAGTLSAAGWETRARSSAVQIPSFFALSSSSYDLVFFGVGDLLLRFLSLVSGRFHMGHLKRADALAHHRLKPQPTNRGFPAVGCAKVTTSTPEGASCERLETPASATHQNAQDLGSGGSSAIEHGVQLPVGPIGQRPVRARTSPDALPVYIWRNPLTAFAIAGALVTLLARRSPSAWTDDTRTRLVHD